MSSRFPRNSIYICGEEYVVVPDEFDEICQRWMKECKVDDRKRKWLKYFADRRQERKIEMTVGDVFTTKGFRF